MSIDPTPSGQEPVHVLVFHVTLPEHLRAEGRREEWGVLFRGTQAECENRLKNSNEEVMPLSEWERFRRTGLRARTVR